MSDLHCAATLLIARHCEAEYATERLSDAGGSLTVRGREQARRLARSLRDARVAMVYTSDMARAVQTGEIVAAELGVLVRVRAGLREWSVGEYAGRPHVAGMFDETFHGWLQGAHDVEVPGGESGRSVLERMSSELQAVADEHRGETVLVVSHGGVISFAVPALAGNVPADYALGRSLGHGEVVEAAVDGDGWVVRSWAGDRGHGARDVTGPAN